VGEGAHAKHRFRVGDTVSGVALPVADPRLETVEFYKVSDLRVSVREMEEVLGGLHYEYRLEKQAGVRFLRSPTIENHVRKVHGTCKPDMRT
jgi:hypothetical protein